MYSLDVFCCYLPTPVLYSFSVQMISETSQVADLISDKIPQAMSYEEKE